MKKKIYNCFKDRFNNDYNFSSYLDFAKFWFNHSRTSLIYYFPHNFEKLNRCACNSKEALSKHNNY